MEPNSDPITAVASMGLSNLLHEPSRLSSEADRLNNELESLVMENYKVFVENLTCSVILRAEDKIIKDLTGQLDGRLRGLSQQCSAFKDRVNHFVDVHKRNRKTLQHHMQLVELLEIPQLVDACSRNGFHDEALELANFVNGLERRHLLAAEVRSVDGKVRGGSSVVQSIVDDVHQTLVTLRLQLLVMFSESIALPKQMSLLATLRKLDCLFIDRQLALERYDNPIMASLSEKQREVLRAQLQQQVESKLQMDYLEARAVWLRKVADRAMFGGGLTSVESGTGEVAEGQNSSGVGSMGLNRSDLGPYGQAIELLEVNRTSWYSIVTQFGALFGASASNYSNSESDSESNCILGAWVGRQVHGLLTELQLLLPAIEGASSLRTVLEQALFFASRMAEVRVDFTGLLLPIFKGDILRRVDKDVALALCTFKTMVSTERVTIEVDEIPKEQMVPLIILQERITGTDSADIGNTFSRGGGRGGEDTGAPVALMSYPPLAYLCNALLCTLNFLRECPLTVLREDVIAQLKWLFCNVCDYLLQSALDIRTRSFRFLDENKGKLRRHLESNGCSTHLDYLFAAAVEQELIPHILLCFDNILPGARQQCKLALNQDRTTEELKSILSSECYDIILVCREKLTKLRTIS